MTYLTLLQAVHPKRLGNPLISPPNICEILLFWTVTQSPALILTLQRPSVVPPDHPLFLLQLLSALFGPFDALPLLSSLGAEGKIPPTLRKERGRIFQYKLFQQTIAETLPGAAEILWNLRS